MQLDRIYQPIKKELNDVEKILRKSLCESGYSPILEITDYLLDSRGKRLRPVLVILSTRASSTHDSKVTIHQLANIASAMELIHMASLIHDDVIDHTNLRHDKPTINCKWNSDVAIALGDYLYSIAFELISACGDPDVLECISSATKAMCEGELIQVCDIDDVELLKERYIVIVKKKTAALFSASCRAGAMLANSDSTIQSALKGYGLNFGIAFQIVDDCLDLIGKVKDLGKSPGADFKMGEPTLPILYLLSTAKDRKRILSLMREHDNQNAFEEIRSMFISSQAFFKTKEDISSYIQKAKESLSTLNNSRFKEALFDLANYISNKVRL